MSQSTSQTRVIVIIGAATLVVVAVALFFWFNRPAAQLKAPSDELIDKLIAARPDQRDNMIIELGNRGPQVIPQLTAAYEKASHDPALRMQLATAIFRINPPAAAIPALEHLLQKEKDPETRRAIQDFIAGLRARPPAGAPPRS